MSLSVKYLAETVLIYCWYSLSRSRHLSDIHCYKIQYSLRPRQHSKQLISKTAELNNRDYIVQRCLLTQAIFSLEHLTTNEQSAFINDIFKFIQCV